MDKNLISYWSPLDLILPEIPQGTESAMFFVTDAGVISGLNITFKQGDWLVYIKKDGIDSWFKADSISVFNNTSSSNQPDPGFYTKVRLDNAGNIIAAEYLNKDDLPKHTHSQDDISGDITPKVQEIVSQMFQHHTDSSVYFEYDKKTKCITAEVNYDGKTISQNEDGELMSLGGGNGGTSDKFTGTIKIDQVENLSKQLSTLDAQIKKNFIIVNNDSALTAKETPGGTIVKVKIDGTSIVMNSEGELSVSPEWAGDGTGSSTICGTHTHSSSQITDFEQAVKDLISQNININVKDIPIDNQTIIINNNGELSAVAAGTQAHKHVMDDITDLNQDIANVWGSDQPLQGDFSEGRWNFTTRTIGYAIDTFNKEFKVVQEQIDNIQTIIDNTVAPEPNKINDIDLTVELVSPYKVYDILDKVDTLAAERAIVRSDFIWPHNKGTLKAFVDGVEYASFDLHDETKVGNYGTWQITEMQDSYKGVPMYANIYTSLKFALNVHSLEEGKHSVYFTHTYDGDTYTSKNCTVETYEKSEYKLSLEYLNAPTNNRWVSGIRCYSGEMKTTFKPLIEKAYTTRYVAKNIFSYRTSINSTLKEVEPVMYTNNNAYFEEQTIEYPEGLYTSISINSYAYNIDTTIGGSAQNHTPNISYNTTDIEQYRVVYAKEYDSQEPSFVTAFQLLAYNPEEAVPKNEFVLRDNKAYFTRTDYSNMGGADYTRHYSDVNGYYWITFRFPTGFVNNCYADILRASGAAFDKNKDGTLKDVKLYAAQDLGTVPSMWVNINKPYIGYGKIEAAELDYAGLDLFKSTDTRRYATWGQRPNINAEYIYFRIGTKSDADCGTLVKTLQESLDEWR